MKLFPWYIMRKNPISYKDMEEFSNEKLVQNIRYYLSQYQTFVMKSKEMVKELENIFERTKNNRILNYKRRIYNLKNVHINQVPEEIAEITTKYKKIFDELILQEKNLKDTFIKTEKVHREKLWNLFNENREITNPLPLVNHEMYHKLGKYLETLPCNHKAKHRKLDSTLLRILACSAYKTSPFSSFTGIELKKFGSSLNEKNEEKVYILEINFYILQKIIQLISQDEELIPQLTYRFAGVSYNKSKMDFIIRHDINRGKIFNNIEQHFTSSNNPIFQALSTYKESLTYQEIVDVLSQFISKDKAHLLFKEGFLKKGILYPDLELDEYSEDILQEFWDTISRLDVKSSKRTVILESIQNISQRLHEYKHVTFQKRFRIYSSIAKSLAQVEQLFDHSFSKENIFYEDYLIRNSQETIAIEPSLLKDISYIQKLAILTSIPLQFRYEFAHKYYDLYKQNLTPIGKGEIRKLYLDEVMRFNNWSNVLAPVDGLKSRGAKVFEKVKEEIRKHLLELKQHGETGEIDKEKVEQWFAHLMQTMDLRITPLSSTVLFQKAEDDYVLNKLYAGNLKLFIRYFHFERGIYQDEDFQKYIQTIFPNNLLEIREGFGFNANYHERFIHHRLMIPYSKTHTRDQSAKSSKNLLYRYNQQTEMVDIVEQSNPDFPLAIDYIGSLVDYMLPPSIRMLTTAISPRFDAEFFNLWEIPEQLEGSVVDHIPRLKLGMLTIIREKWLLSTENMVKEEHSSDYDNYVALIDIFKENELPLEFFVSKYITRETFDFANSNRSEMKPQYMNLYSPLFVKEFKKLIKEEKFIVLKEFYPKQSHHTHNMEYQIEVNLE
ncbi:lantibiotic dehydratase [Virgibacillus proomii]|uniref:lantibiotic dehydratase n=1 Tax=Virgibacillus proomii TaxID=84407 RepID=UPI0009861A43|nr:lantibiotic dehydratase [Virgibacillus proomii]